MTPPRRARHFAPPLRPARGLPWLLAGLIGAGCASDDDLPVGNLGDTTEVDEGLLPPIPGVAGDGRDTDPFWCRGEAPEPLPTTTPGQVVGFLLNVREWSSSVSMASRGLSVKLCSPLDFPCMQPLTSDYAVREGMIGSTPLPPSLPAGAAGVPVPEGFDGFLQFNVINPDAPEAQQFLPLNYTLGGPVIGHISVGPTLLMAQLGTWVNALQQSFPGVPINFGLEGIVITGVFDCNNAPVRNARVEILVAGGVTALDRTPLGFTLPESRIPIAQPSGEPLLTGSSGMVGFINVPPGTVQLRAFLNDDAVPFASIELGSVTRQMSVGMLRPDYRSDANFMRTLPVPAEATQP